MQRQSKLLSLFFARKLRRRDGGGGVIVTKLGVYAKYLSFVLCGYNGKVIKYLKTTTDSAVYISS